LVDNKKKRIQTVFADLFEHSFPLITFLCVTLLVSTYSGYNAYTASSFLYPLRVGFSQYSNVLEENKTV